MAMRALLDEIYEHLATHPNGRVCCFDKPNKDPMDRGDDNDDDYVPFSKWAPIHVRERDPDHPEEPFFEIEGNRNLLEIVEMTRVDPDRFDCEVYLYSSPVECDYSYPTIYFAPDIHGVERCYMQYSNGEGYLYELREVKN
jgi:hypothetical protein